MFSNCKIIANLATLSSNVYLFLPLFWIYIFAGSIIIPAANGISLVSVDKKFAGAASSISILIYNVLGRFPGPNLYAFFKNIANDEHWTPMWLLLNLAVIGFLAVLIALKFNKKKFIKLREELLKNERKEKSNFENNETEEVETLIVGGDDDDEKENKENNNGEENNNNENNKENNKESKIIKFVEENNQEEIIN